MREFGAMTAMPSARERILDAAIRLMWRDGYDAVSVDTICAEAGARKGSFYHAFPSKEELLNAAIRRVWDTDRPQIEKIYQSEDPPLLKFRNHIEWFGLSQRRLKAQYGYVPGVFNMAIGVNAPQSTREIIAKARQAHIDLITHAIHAIFSDRGVDEAVISWWVSITIQLLNGATIEARLNNSLTPYDTLPESVLAVLGLGAPPNVSPPAQTP